MKVSNPEKTTLTKRLKTGVLVAAWAAIGYVSVSGLAQGIAAGAEKVLEIKLLPIGPGDIGADLTHTPRRR